MTRVFLAKAAAAREKDRVFCTALLAHGHVTLARVLALVSSMPLDDKQQRALRATIRRWARSLGEIGHDIEDS